MFARLCLTAVPLLSLSIASFANALCIATRFEEDISRAHLIVVGDVIHAECARLPNTVVTRYKFAHLHYIKGSGPGDTLTLTEEGGRFGNMMIYSEHEIDFRIGSRYIVFAQRGYWSFPDEYGPMLCGRTVFGVWPDSGSVDPSVHFSGKSIGKTEDQFVRELATRIMQSDSTHAR